MSSCLSQLKTKAVPVTILIILNASLDLLSDLDTVVDDVATNLPGERDWVAKGERNTFKLLPVLFRRATVLQGCLNILNSISNILDASDDSINILLLEVLVCLLGILNDMLPVLNAVLNISEALSLDGAHEQALGDLELLLSINRISCMGSPV